MGGIASAVGTLLVQGPHHKGFVSSLAQLLASAGATVVDSSHHAEAGMFFQRIRFDASYLERDLEPGLEALARRHDMRWRIAPPDRVKRVAILVSKQEHCLYDLLLRHRAGELACAVELVISNHPDLAPIAEHFGVPFHHLPITAATKPMQEAALLRLLDDIDLVVLARYMQILSPELVARFPERIINIHHSFLPAFVGASPYRQAHERGVKVIGATSHYVTAELDQGPIIDQDTIRCTHRDSVEDLVRKGRDLEKRVLAAAVRWHVDDRVLSHGGKTVVFD
ncbi:MAG: formyltetrahydrofolate deformylase [Deltaproteobacteria bacterium]|nr:formyltetrahydrofolate deformylase [Deltaproteobacteria bacterium]